MIADLNNLVRLNKSQIKPVTEILARAFQDDPLFVYFFPDPSERAKRTPYQFQFLLRHAVAYGEVYATSPNLEGTALWLPSEKNNTSFWRKMRCGGLLMASRIGKEASSRRQHFLECTASVHKRHTSFRHWYLKIMGVDPVFQGKGYAGTLLKAMLARTDEEHLPCCLNTQNEKNVSFYQHYGFELVEETTIPGTEVSNWAMLRKPQSVST